MASTSSVSETFIEYSKNAKDENYVWNYFLREEKGQSAKCKLCNKILKTGGGSTKGLHVHLESAHQKKLLKRKAEVLNLISNCATAEAAKTATGDICVCEPNSLSASKGGPKSKEKKMTDYFTTREENSLEATLSRMTARDGLSFNVFCTSTDLREALKAKGFTDIPTTNSGIRNIIVKYSSKVRRKVINEISILKSEGKKFSLTFDEYTSVRNRRYMNINIHSANTKVWSLGLVRVFGSMNAETCVQLLSRKILEHGISLEDDIVSIVTDGASVMKKVGNIISAEQQLCFAHGVQLGVLDVLYKKKHSHCDKSLTSAAPVSTYDKGSSTQDQVAIEEVLTDSDDEYSETESDDDSETDIPDLKINYQPLVEKVRTVIRIFRRSPTRNDDILQRYVTQDLGKQLSLILDSKTRWNSLLLMLERFLLLKDSIRKALIDLKSQNSFSEEEIGHISDIVSALQPVKAAVEALCRKDANLLTADVILKFMVDKLKENKTTLSLELRNALLNRISERRTEFSGVLQYLHCKRRQNIDGHFTVPSATIRRNLIKKLLLRLDKDTRMAQSEMFEEPELEIVQRGDEKSDKTIEEQINCAIKKSLSEKVYTFTEATSVSAQQRIISIIDQEMKLFENGGSRGRHLQLIYDYLLTIPPTSVESERAFSAAGILCTKLRSRLSDATFDAIAFLRAYFKNNEYSIS